MVRDHRRLAAIVSADVAGYSRLMGRDDSDTLARLKAHRRELIDPKIAEYDGRIDGALTRVLDEATKQLLDRLQHGDPYVVGGEVKRRPVAAKDLAIIAGVAFDKRQLCRNLPDQSPGPKGDSVRDLAEMLQAYVVAKRKAEGEGQASRGCD